MNHHSTTLMLALAAGLSPFAAVAQSPCATSLLQGPSLTKSSDLICVIPQDYGAGGLVTASNSGPLSATSGHEAHFQASALSNFGAVNSEIGVQLGQLPIASPVSGIVFENGVWTTAINFGPVLADRAETIGKKKIFIGASYQYFNFDRVDAVNLHSFGTVLTHEAEPGVCGVQLNVQCTNTSPAAPIYTQDIIDTLNRVDLKVHQITLVGTVGLTNAVEVSVAVPLLETRMNMNSNATIFNFEPPPVNHSFTPAAVATNPKETYIDAFDANFRNPGSAKGVGDLTFRGKDRAWSAANEKSALAVGVDVRVPTGDAENFLGSGTWGVRPFATYTYFGRVSPHATVGVQSNGNSILAGDVTQSPVTRAKLPDLFSYSAGADAALGRRLSLSSDFFAQTLLNAAKIRSSLYTDYVGATHANIATSTGNESEYSVSVGGKVDIAQRLLLSANVLFRVNNAGLHSKPVPLIGFSYTF